jgi:hypothetical protein
VSLGGDQVDDVQHDVGPRRPVRRLGQREAGSGRADALLGSGDSPGDRRLGK